MSPALYRKRASIVVTCILIGACAESPVTSDGTQEAPPSSSQATLAPTQSLDDGYSSIRDGVFSLEQSRRGEAHYLEVCERCHEKDLAGGGDFDDFVPPLVGEEFLDEWKQWTVGDLFEFMTTEMPPKRKDRADITADTYVDVLAYILEQNGFPAGPAELPTEFDPLLMIEMSLTR